jgi:hypothetical protein
MKFKYILIIFAIVIPGLKLTGQTDTVPFVPLKIMVANVEPGRGLSPDFTISKVYAALNFAAGLSSKYQVISPEEIDSTTILLSKSFTIPSVENVAINLGADRIFFITVNQIKNMLRVEIVGSKPGDTTFKGSGTGYSLLHYRNNKTYKPLYDPSLLEALQRAFAAEEDDSAMFANASGKFRVFPAKTLAIGGIAFVNDTTLPPWSIFENKIIKSFTLAETIFEAAKDSPNYTVYDIDTRDSIYAIFNMYAVENCNPPTRQEIDALQKFQVERFLSGVMMRNNSGITVEIYLCDMNNGIFKIIDSDKQNIDTDSMEKLQKLIKQMTAKLLENGK